MTEQAKGEQETMPTVRTAAMSFDEVVESTAGLPEAQRNSVRWMYSYMKMENITLREAAAVIKRDASTLHRVFRNKYGADIDAICKDIESFRRVAEERRSISSAGFVETSISLKIWQVCDWALISQSIVFIFGDSQIGKTISLEEYARRHNHGVTRMFRMPSTAGVQLMMKTMADTCLVSRNSSFENLRERVMKCIDRNTLVIADEVHQTFQSYHKNARVTALELLREIHDRTHCGMVLCGTNVLREEVQRGRHKEMLEQLQRRGVVQLQLPARPPRRDLDKIAKAYGLPSPEGEPEELVKQIIQESGLGKMIKFMQAATRLASKRSERLSWMHFVAAHDILAKLSVQEGGAR
jgi:DNA transposition AAA+ family ATPase